MLLVIDNYDSFVHNLARHMALAGWAYEIARNDALTLADIERMAPKAILLSPGPCSPAQAGICVEAVRAFGSSTPILGVCLGHQCIGEAYGAETARADRPVHGKSAMIRHEGRGIFAGLPDPLQAGRYHSLVVRPGSGRKLRITARTDEGEIMALEHESHPVYGVQFHPESILTPGGLQLLENFTGMARLWHERMRTAA